MQSFVQHYKNEDQINEFTWGQLAKGFIRPAKNILGKRVVGVGVNLMTSLADVDRSTYNFVQGALTNNFKANKSSKGKKGKDPIYIKDVFKGEIDDSAKKLGGYENIKNNIRDISVYQTNKLGRITTFFLKDENGDEEFYIGTNWAGDKHFKDLFGAWVTGLASRLNQMRKSKSKTELKKVIEDPIKYLEEPLIVPTRRTKTAAKTQDDEEKETDIGIMDITMDELRALEKAWGDGKSGGVTKGGEYPFRHSFQRQRFYNNLGRGYKYFDKRGHAVYLIDLGDNMNAMIAFEGKDSSSWATGLGMLDFWRTSMKGSKDREKSSRWIKGNINQLPEGNENV